jgi:hypothetical protein
MEYNINTFFNKDECKNILNFLDENGVTFFYSLTETWDCKRLYDDNFKQYFYDLFKKMWKENRLSLWFNFDEFKVNDINISLTKYYDGRFLELHRDVTSQLTTVIVLTDNFNDGRFVISKNNTTSKFEMLDGLKLIDIKMGEGITFDGSQIFHGVLPVISGIRCAMNIWMSKSKDVYPVLKNINTLI